MPNPSVKILLLDDDTDFQKLVLTRFRPQGYEFMVFSDPSEALSRSKGDPHYFAQFDLILTDFRMPKVDGIEFIRQFRELSQHAPIILMTGTNKVELAVEAIKAGAHDFVVKPVNFDRLSLSIERALDLRKLREQNEILKSTIKSSWAFEGVVGKSAAIRSVFDLAKRVANTSANVMIHGESGTGKEVMAKAIHRASARRDGPFVAINCSAIPETLLESELFGHAKGAFTGAHEKKGGIFEEANGGTLFLDEVGDLSLPLQAKLLRVLQERKVKRVGENVERDIDIRLLVATHKDLRKEVHDKNFREDLYFRMNVIQLKIPPLRERKEDILPLAEHFFQKFSAQNQVLAKGFSQAAFEHLLALPWPGNVRELENAVERAVILAKGELIEAADLPQREDYAHEAPIASAKPGMPTLDAVLGGANTKIPTLGEFSRLYVAYVLKQVGGVKEQAARVLEIDRKTLYRKIADLESHADAAPPPSPTHAPVSTN